MSDLRPLQHCEGAEDHAPANPTTLVGLISSIPDDQTAIIQPEQNIRISKTSMLQDWEAGRPMELEAVVGAVVELGERLGVPMPSTRGLRLREAAR